MSTSSAHTTPYTLYGGPKNRGLRVLWALEELEQPYQLIDLNLFGGEQRSDAFLKLNPAGKVPALIDHDVCDAEGHPLVVTESVAILNYLADKHRDHERPLIPHELSERALFHQWMSYGATELEPPAWMYAKQTFIYPPDRRVEAIKPTCAFEFKRATRHLNEGLADGRPFILGEALSAADIFIAQTLMWGALQGLEVESGPAQGYLERLKARPALGRALKATPSS